MTNRQEDDLLNDAVQAMRPEGLVVPVRAYEPGIFKLDDTKERRNYRDDRGQKVDSVTQVVKVLDKPALLFWAWKLGTQGVSMDDARQGAANIGTVAHARIEAWLRDMVVDSQGIPEDVMAQSDEAVERFKAWWREQGFEVDNLEYPMVNCDVRIGGRLDIGAKRGDRRVLVDIKTSKGFYSEQFLQLGGYYWMRSRPHLTESSSGVWTPASPDDVFKYDEVWVARVGKEEVGDMDAAEVPVSEIEMHALTFEGMARNHYNLKRSLARRK